MNEQTEVLKEIRQFKELIDKGEALERLKRNPDFTSIITDGLLKERALELTYSPNADSVNTEGLEALRYLDNYLNAISIKAMIAKNQMPYQEELLIELNNE